MKIAINYADKTFREAQKYNTKSAYAVGGVDLVVEYSPNMLDKQFIAKNEHFFEVGDPQIGKYGLWRPLILKDAFEKASIGDFVFYCDSGCYYIGDIQPLVNIMQHTLVDFMVFELPFIEKYWTKRDVFTALDADIPEVFDTNQRMSTAFMFRKSDMSEAVLTDYYSAAIKYPELFSDKENIRGRPNYKGFVQNRHNQSVLSVITKKYKLPAFRDLTEYGTRPKLYQSYGYDSYLFNFKEYTTSSYPQLLVQHRRGIVNARVRLYGLFRSRMPAWLTDKIIRASLLRKSLVARL